MRILSWASAGGCQKGHLSPSSLTSTCSHQVLLPTIPELRRNTALHRPKATSCRHSWILHILYSHTRGCTTFVGYGTLDPRSVAARADIAAPSDREMNPRREAKGRYRRGHVSQRRNSLRVDGVRHPRCIPSTTCIFLHVCLSIASGIKRPRPVYRWTRKIILL